MRIYLTGHTRSDIDFTVNFGARYMFCPKISHELGLKRLAQYLKHTQGRGLVLGPNSGIFKVEAYPDAQFVGMYGQKNPNNPV